MKRLILWLLLLPILSTAEAKSRRALYCVTFPSRDNAVVIKDLPDWTKGAEVWCEGNEIPSQLDDLDGDGRYDELVFLFEGLPSDYRGVVEGGEAAEYCFEVRYFSRTLTHHYPSRVNAQMWLKGEQKQITEIDSAASFQDDMYRKLHHHGPAFESERVAYRIYFDKKQSVDTYGKKHPQLELRKTNWYTTDEQLAQGFGHDNLRVFGSISVGALKGWDASRQRMTHITEMHRRKAIIRARGPLRTVVDMCVEGWKYAGREIDMTSRYILYAGHEGVQVENRLLGDLRDLCFTTGVMKIRDGFVATLQDSVLMSVGEDFPENDTVRWQRERVALAVALPGKQILSQQEDDLSHLAQLKPDAEGCINYRFWMWWQKSEWLSDEDFYSEQGLARMGNWRYWLLKPEVRRLR